MSIAQGGTSSPVSAGRSGIPRRAFLQRSLIVAGGLAVSCAGDRTLLRTPLPLPTPREIPEPTDELRFLDGQGAATLDAIIGRLIPGDPTDPGAREAGVLFFIDGLLATFAGATDEPTYLMEPAAMPVPGDPGPQPAARGTIRVAEDQLDRYGYQLVLTVDEIYRRGLAATDRAAGARFGGSFASLGDRQQDRLLEEMEDDEAPGFGVPGAGDFFQVVKDHTVQGMFSDPVYGGNRDMVGWRLIGYPGAQRGYAPEEMRDPRLRREPQSLAHLPPVQPGHTHRHDVELPVRGSGEQRRGA